MAIERRYASEFIGSRHERLFVRAVSEDDVEMARSIAKSAPFAREAVRHLMDDPAFVAICSPVMYAGLWDAYFADVKGRWSEHGFVISVWAASKVPASADQLAALSAVVELHSSGQGQIDALTYLWEAPFSDGRVLLSLPLRSVAEITNQSSKRGEEATSVMDATFGYGFSACLETTSALSMTLGDLVSATRETQHALHLLASVIRTSHHNSPWGAIEKVKGLPESGAALAEQMLLHDSSLTVEELLDVAACIDSTSAPTDSTID